MKERRESSARQKQLNTLLAQLNISQPCQELQNNYCPSGYSMLGQMINPLYNTTLLSHQMWVATQSQDLSKKWSSATEPDPTDSWRILLTIMLIVRQQVLA